MSYLPPVVGPKPLLQSVLFPDGTRVLLQLVQQYSLSGSTVTVTFNDSSTFSYTASGPTAGGQIIAAIDKVIQNGWTFFQLSQATAS